MTNPRIEAAVEAAWSNTFQFKGAYLPPPNIKTKVQRLPQSFTKRLRSPSQQQTRRLGGILGLHQTIRE